MTIFGLGLAIYIIENIVQDDSVKSNDNHEISILGREIGSESARIESNHSSAESSPSSSKIKNEKKPKSKANGSNGVISFENNLFNDPLAMSRLPDPDRKNSGGEETEMEDVIIDDNPKK